MIEKINSLIPSTTKEFGLRGDTVEEKNKFKKSPVNSAEASDKSRETDVDNLSIPPPNIRYLGKNLDLIA